MRPPELPVGAAERNVSKATEKENGGAKSLSDASEEMDASNGVDSGEKKPRKRSHTMTERSKKESEKQSETDVLYNVVCCNRKGFRSGEYVMPENPFDDADVSGLEDPQSPMVIQVLIEATGRGTLPTFPGMRGRQMRLPPPPPLGTIPRSYDSYDSADDISYVSENSDDIGNETGVEDIGFDGPRRQRTLSLREILDRGDFRASSVEVTGIRIHSKKLLNLLRSFVREYPSQTLKGDVILVKSPFRMLAHYYKDLICLRDEKFHEIDVSKKDKEALKPLDKETKYDLNVLLKYFERHYTKDLWPEEIKLKDAGVVSHSMLWFLFKPGMPVYARMRGKLAGFIFERYDEEQERERLRERQRGDKESNLLAKLPFWDAVCWNLSYNGRRIVRFSQTFTIKEYTGEKDILSLPVFPAMYLDATDGGRTRNKLLELGQKFYNIIRDSPAHLQYSGPAWSFGGREPGDAGEGWQRMRPDSEYTGEIIVDHRRTSYNRRGGYDAPRVVREPRVTYYSDSGSGGDDSDSEAEEPTTREPLLELDTKSSPRNFQTINPKDQELLTPQHYYLFPRAMTGFALTQKQTMGFDVENIKPMNWPSKEEDPMSTLILGDSDKDVIKALAKKYSKNKDRWGADFIRGKGEGQIFLLHGPPGTGKTYTVECVAKFTRRPLLRLTVADIGTDERDMEDNLGEWFQRGADWGAIILLDEADVFLEKRQVKDLERNSLVSVFLSSMEYYTGMLFLTTNRIGQIDDAFLSRTSIAITYETLDIGKQRRIWEGFLKKLSEERKDIVLTDRAKKFLEGLDKTETTKDVPWNGREIRNALQTAIALASYDADKEAEDTGIRPSKITVRDEHFQAVVDRRKEFIDYRKSIRNMDEDARAFTEGNRAPPQRKPK